MGENEKLTLMLAIITGAIILTLVIIGLASALSEFKKELRYLNREIKRTRGAEREHYIRRRNRLWLSLIPFVKY